MVIVLLLFCGCQWEGRQRPQSAFQRLVLGGCAYSEVPVAERDELSGAVAQSIHHWMQRLWTQEESTERKPLLRWLGFSDLIMWLCKLWTNWTGANGEQETGGAPPPPPPPPSQTRRGALSSTPSLILNIQHIPTNITLLHHMFQE